jgi:membrane protein DedA with SNARE-associated domain
MQYMKAPRFTLPNLFWTTGYIAVGLSLMRWSNTMATEYGATSGIFGLVVIGVGLILFLSVAIDR